MSEDQIYRMYLFVEHRNAIAISFDSSWKPFIGYTRVYNAPAEEETDVSSSAPLRVFSPRFSAFLSSSTPNRVLPTANPNTIQKIVTAW